MSLTNPYSTKTDDVSTITALETNTAGAYIARAIDGTMGGTYTPANVIDFENEGIRLGGGGNGHWLRLTSRSVPRKQQLRLCNVSVANLSVGNTADGGAGAAQDASAWIVNSDLNTPAVRTRSHNADGHFSWLEIDPPDGQALVSVEITSMGLGAATTPTQVPKYKIIRWVDGGTVTDLSSLTDDAHTTGGGGNYLTTVVATTITVTGNGTIDLSTYRYAVLVDHPYSVATTNGMYIYSLSPTYTVTDMRVK